MSTVARGRPQPPPEPSSSRIKYGTGSSPSPARGEKGLFSCRVPAAMAAGTRLTEERPLQESAFERERRRSQRTLCRGLQPAVSADTRLRPVFTRTRPSFPVILAREPESSRPHLPRPERKDSGYRLSPVRRIRTLLSFCLWRESGCRDRLLYQVVSKAALSRLNNLCYH